MLKLFFFLFHFLFCFQLFAQRVSVQLSPEDGHRCYTMEAIREAIAQNPGIEEEWRKQGEAMYQNYLERRAFGRGTLADTIIIPVVFHLVDEESRLSWITDRNIYDQIEILNHAYNGVKADQYKHVIPGEIYARKGEVPIRFVLARRTPDGNLTDGIERRVNTTPGRKDIKSYSAGGLDPWDTEKYLNVWVGTFSGSDNNLLGVATFPFTTSEGPQGVVIGSATIPYTTNISRSYYPVYSEGATLAHEVGHYFYLYHVFGDQTICNDTDFKIQSGWPLPAGAGTEGDDTPAEKMNDNTSYGNPSMNFSDGCATESFGQMYGSFMNYFDDRAMFMFSDGQRKRIEGCIELYRSNLAGSDGATPPENVTDAYLVSVSPYGNPERQTQIINQLPLIATIRNYGNTQLNTVKVTLEVDGSHNRNQEFTVNLAPGQDAEVNLGPLNLSQGNRILKVYTSLPNGSTDDFTTNDTLESFVSIVGTTVTAPYSQNFDSEIFPPAGWQVWNGNQGDNSTWTRNSASGYTAAGAATLQFRTFSGAGQIDDLIMPAIDPGTSDSSVLSFRYAYAAYHNTNLSYWDGLEVYLSNDEGRNYQLVLKKTGGNLKTVAPPQTTPFTAPPSEPGRWQQEKINLTPYLNGKPLLVKFRGVNAKGNNLYIDDVQVSVVTSINREVQLLSVSGIPDYACSEMPSMSVSFRNNGKDVLENVKINYTVNDGAVVSKTWEGALNPNASTTYHFDQFDNLPAGKHLITVYSSDPNGLEDQYPENDTTHFSFFVMGKATTPLHESFESNVLPPAQWLLNIGENYDVWDRSTDAASDNNASLVIRNYEYDLHGFTGHLISPVISTDKTYDSLFLSFDYAYAPGSNYPGARGESEDSLSVYITRDCGSSFTGIFKSGGLDLITVSDPENRKNSSFEPNSSDWKTVRISLSAGLMDSDFQVFFSATGNHRNNLYIDNIQVYGVVVPPLLKEKGYLLYPSPFKDQFVIRNYEQPVDLQAIQIYTAAGQLIWQQQYPGDAQKEIHVNTAGWQRGMYMVRMKYKTKTIVEKVLKH